jgi:hypothetical protein
LDCSVCGFLPTPSAPDVLFSIFLNINKAAHNPE